MMRIVEGNLDSVEFEKKLAEQLVSKGNKPETRRCFIGNDELIHANEKTYAVRRCGEHARRKRLISSYEGTLNIGSRIVRVPYNNVIRNTVSRVGGTGRTLACTLLEVQ